MAALRLQLRALFSWRSRGSVEMPGQCSELGVGLQLDGDRSRASSTLIVSRCCHSGTIGWNEKLRISWAQPVAQPSQLRKSVNHLPLHLSLDPGRRPPPSFVDRPSPERSITARGQTVIPAPIRARFALGPSQRLIADRQADRQAEWKAAS